MAVLQMKKICICALKKERKPILEQIQKNGVMQVCHIEDDIDEVDFAKMETHIAQSAFERNASEIERALEILNEHEPEKKGMFDSFKGKPVLSEEDFAEVVKKREEAAKVADIILKTQKDLLAKQTDINKLNGQIEAIDPWLNMDVPGLTTGTLRTSYFYGYIQEYLTQEELYQKIEENGTFPDASDARIFYSDQKTNMTCIAGFCMKGEEEIFEAALRSIGFTKPPIIMRSVPEKSLEKWQARLVTFAEEKAQLTDKIKSFEDKRYLLRCSADYFRARADKYKILGDLYQSKHTFFITGYVPEKFAESFVDELEAKYQVAISTMDVGEDEEAPVLLENNKFSEPVEGVVDSFGLPKKNELDPSGLMAISYYVLFGVMLSDAAYGLIMFGACFALIMAFPKMEKGLRKTLKMFMFCGISTTFWGLMFGGFFGDAIPVISESFFGKRVELPPIWFNPQDEPMRLLLVSLCIGLAHMLLGLMVKAYMLIKKKKYLDCFCDVGFWIMLLFGLVMLLASSDMFKTIFSAGVTVSDIGLKVIIAITIVGALGLLFTSGRRQKNWALRIVLGLYELYGISGWLSDILSYSRLLALGLATGVIAQVVNLMGAMPAKSLVGVPVFIIVFIIGHTLNMAINLLGAYVHTNRLEFVEYFGKFYEGGGESFKPFKLNNKYVEVE
ncbi:MAG: V-type ATP synthase subunit I [Lachnospiraceae bacterium]|jgi:V/A-type H+-transporting ATPase subunit I|nr:V-type ATP synthase subunit I [Lachnospiraceae bacterium]